MDRDEGSRCVVVSSSVADRVLLPEDLPCFTVGDVLKKVLQLVAESADHVCTVLFFLSPTEAPVVDDFCRGFSTEKLCYRLVVSAQDRYAGDLERVLSVRTSRITEEEVRFLAARAFAVPDGGQTAVDPEKTVLAAAGISDRDSQSDLKELINIGRNLSLERDTEKLLRAILYLSKKITGADAGSIFLVEGNAQGGRQIRFKYSHTFSKDLAYEEFVMACDTSSIAGYVAVTGEVLNIPDVYALEEGLPYEFNRSYDRAHGYRTKSMLVVPMRNHLDQIVGVIQLLNSKEGQARSYTGNEAFEIRLASPQDLERLVVAFKPRYERLLEAVAGQAAIALENNLLIRRITEQFEEFVKASVTAIESQDPATSGHSARVARICVALAEAVNGEEGGHFRDVSFSASGLKELELAGLLHDFGKVYVDPAVYLKGKKLYGRDMDLLKMRLAFLHRTIELVHAEEEGGLRLTRPRDREERCRRLQERKKRELENLGRIEALVDVLNEPTLRDTDPEQLLAQIDELSTELAYRDLVDAPIPILSDRERENLAIKRGSLNADERRIIESHVRHTYTFVSKIPWPPEYGEIPEIVARHHEKLDGSGYPDGLAGEENIGLPARMMTLADIFDALTAPDRPYKKSVPMERALAILRAEAAEGKLDRHLVELFIEKGIYRKALRKAAG